VIRVKVSRREFWLLARLGPSFESGNLIPHSNRSSSYLTQPHFPEIDFMDLGRIMNEIEGFGVEAASSKNDSGTSIKMAEGQTTATTVGTSFMRDPIDIKPSPTALRYLWFGLQIKTDNTH
jgi:hypothetical protein